MRKEIFVRVGILLTFLTIGLGTGVAQGVAFQQTAPKPTIKPIAPEPASTKTLPFPAAIASAPIVPITFNPRYFLPLPTNKLWQKNWNYQQKLLLEQSQAWTFKQGLNLLNTKQLEIIRKIAAKQLVSNFAITVVTTVNSLLQVFFNRNPNNTAWLEIDQLFQLVKTILTAAKAEEFKIDANFKAKFATDELASNEFTKHFQALFGVNNQAVGYETASSSVQKKLLVELTQISAESLWSRRKYRLEKLFKTYPDWFNPNDEIDLADSWNKQWDNTGGFVIKKIKDLVAALNKGEILLTNVIAALKSHVEDHLALVLKLSTDKKSLIDYTILLLTTSIYNPILYLEPNNQFVPKVWINFLADLVRYFLWKADPAATGNALTQSWDETKFTVNWERQIVATLYKTINQVTAHLRVKKLTIPTYFNSPPANQLALNLDQIGNILSGQFSTVKNNFLKEEIEKVLQEIPIFFRKNRSAIFKYIKDVQAFVFPTALELSLTDYQTVLDKPLQTRLISIIEQNSAQLNDLHSKIINKVALSTTYFDVYKHNDLLMQKYQPVKTAEAKHLLRINVFDQKTLKDYTLLLRKKALKWEIVYCDFSLFHKQLENFIANYRGNEVIDEKQLQFKFSLTEAAKLIQLIKTHKIPFPAQFNLKGSDFDSASRITATKLAEQTFTNEQRFEILQNASLQTLQEMVFTAVIGKLLEIVAKAASVPAAEQTLFEKFITDKGIIWKDIKTDAFKNYSTVQLEKILALQISEYDSKQNIEKLKEFLTANQAWIVIAKLVPTISILTTTKISLNDLTETGGLSAAKEAALKATGLTTAEFEAIKLEVEKVRTELEKDKDQAAKRVIRQALVNMQMFNNIATALKTDQAKLNAFYQKLGISNASDVDTNSKLYTKMTTLSAAEQEQLNLYNGLFGLNQLLNAYPNPSWSRNHKFFYASDLKTLSYAYYTPGDYYWFSTSNLSGKNIKSFALPANDANRLAVIQTYNLNQLTADDKKFLLRLSQNATFAANGSVRFADSLRLLYEVSYWLQTWPKWKEPTN